MKQGESGSRFQACYDRQQQQGGGLLAVRLLLLSTGLVLVIGGLVLVPAPGPGWAIVFLGLALLSMVWRPVARLLDWAEPKLVSAINRGKAWWIHRARHGGRQ